MTSSNRSNLLFNKTILITRPDGREAHLKQLIEQARGYVIHYPVVSIQPPSELDIKQLRLLRNQLQRFDMAIFISPTAVEQSQVYFPALPEHFTIVSIGSKTTQALAQQNINVDIEAPGFNTESLLSTTEFQMPNIQGQRILIFRGTDGLPLLGDTLVQRGAHIRYVETYQRQLPPHPPLTFQQINTINAITISSNEGLDNLIILMEDPTLLIDVPIFVPSQRATTLARQHGFKTIVTAKNATDEEIFQAMSRFFNKDK